MAGAEFGGNIAEIGHGVDVVPDLGNRHDDIGMAEAEASGDLDARVMPNKDGGYAPNYTPLATVDIDSGLIVAADVLNAIASTEIPTRLRYDSNMDLSPDCPLRRK